jgi:hypothetical protein
MESADRPPAQAELPPRAGIGLRAPHYREILDTRPDIGWLEVHSENYFGRGGQPLHYLERARCHYPLSLHGVGLSLGSADGLRQAHLMQLKALVERFDPAFVSDHLCWGAIGERHLNDLLPLPYTEAALDAVCINVVRAQEFLGRQILVENVSSYLQFSDSTIPEWEFVGEVARRTGCGLLLDVNNIYVSAVNHGFDALHYLDAIPAHAVAGPVWNLYGEALTRFGPVPTLIEWDTDLPPLVVLLQEAAKAQEILNQWTMETTHALAA